MIDRLPFASSPSFQVHGASAATRFVPEFSNPRKFSFSETALTWLRFMAGIKQSVSLRKKAAPRNFIALLPFSFSKQSR